MSRRDPRRVVYVPLTTLNINYGFRTNIDEGDATVLGHVAVAGAYPDNFVLGANAPKPPRASRVRITGTTSSFISPDQIATARAAGWRLTGRTRTRSGANTLRSTPVYVNIGGIKYAWNMPDETYTAIAGDAAGLGIQAATSADTDLVWGASFPKPPKVAKLVITGDDTTNYSTFCDSSRVDSLPDDWRKVKDGYIIGP